MSRVCLVGVGDPSFRPAPVHAGPGLRLGHLATALTRAGHDVLVLAAHNASSASRSPSPRVSTCEIASVPVSLVDVPEHAFLDGRAAARVSAFAPDAIVGVTVLGAALACRLVGDVPLWADVFGDVMAEAQAKALVHGDDAALVRFWSLLAPVLERGDHFSAVSTAQANALIGQLGLVGRLGRATAGEPLVSVMPCAAEASPMSRGDPRGQLPDETIPADAFLVLWSGSFNTWCDVATLCSGLERAMERDPSIYFVATGGTVAGHDETTYLDFAERVSASRFARRFRLRGWVSAAEADAWSSVADVGVVVERDVYERRLGSENRVVQWLARGLPCVTSARSELGRDLTERGLAFSCGVGDAAALAQTLLAAAADRVRLRAIGEAGRAHCAEHFGFARTAAPLLAWCAAPRRAADHGAAPAIRIQLREPKAMAHLLEAYLDELKMREVAFRATRWLIRRVLRSASSAQTTWSPRGQA